MAFKAKYSIPYDWKVVYTKVFNEKKTLQSRFGHRLAELTAPVAK
jgi:hypothetical protein